MIVNKANFSEVDGARTRNHRIDSPQDQSSSGLSDKQLQQQANAVAPTVAPAIQKTNENSDAVDASVEELEVNSKPIDTDFAAALKMLAMLPLSDEERAEAVRRLLMSGNSQ